MCGTSEGGVDHRLHNEENIVIIGPSLWSWKCRHIVIQLLHHLIDGFTVDLPFDLMDIFDVELGCALVNSSQIGHQLGHFIQHVVVSTSFRYI